MRPLLKLPLLALLCAVSVEATLSRNAIAGTNGVTLPESGSTGVADTFSPGTAGANPNLSPDQLFSSRIYNGLSNALNNIQQRQSVTAYNGQSVPITPAQVTNLASLFLGPNPSSSLLGGIQQQLNAEMGGPVISLSPLGNSTGDLQTAINSANALIMNLSPQQLAAAAKSPTFLAILELLEEGGEALRDNKVDPRFQAGSDAFSLINMSLAEIVEVTPEPVQAQPRLNTPAATPQPAPRTEPGFQQPVRGLW